jgi:hypothetical protein
MIFESLHESNEKGELLLLDGGYCRWHQRRDRMITIYEIISQKPGVGQQMLARLIEQKPTAIVAKCPVDLAANTFWLKRGFRLDHTEQTKSRRMLNVYILDLPQQDASNA